MPRKMQIGLAAFALTIAAPTGFVSQPSRAKSPQRTTPPRSRNSVRNCTSFELGISSAAMTVEQGTSASRAPPHHASVAGHPAPRCAKRRARELVRSCAGFIADFPFVPAERLFQPRLKALLTIKARKGGGQAARSLAQRFRFEQLDERFAKRARSCLPGSD